MLESFLVLPISVEESRNVLHLPLLLHQLFASTTLTPIITTILHAYMLTSLLSRRCLIGWTTLP